MYIGFLYVLVVIGMRFLKDGVDSYEGTYAAVGYIMVTLQLLQFMEVLHPIFGYTKTNIIMAFMQVFGRFMVICILIDPEPRMQTKPVIFYLFFVWSVIEITRYPYYITQIYNRENGLITWLRYTIWIPLYPLGFVCEGVIMLRSIPYFEETGKFSLSLPNSYNFAFSLPLIIRCYLLFLLLPGIYTLMSHMYKMRVKKLGPNKWQKSRKVK